MLAQVTNEGTRAEIRLPRMIVTSEFRGEGSQPWGGARCYRYHVSVSAAPAIVGKGEFQELAYGSQYDYERGDNAHAEELAWLVLGDLLDAYNDPGEFFAMAMGEPDSFDLDRVRGILSVIDYAEMIGGVLEENAEEIWEARDR